MAIKLHSIKDAIFGVFRAFPRYMAMPLRPLTRKSPPQIVMGSGPRVFYVANGYRHWISDFTTWLKQNNVRWPEDVKIITDERLRQYTSGRPLARKYSDSDWHNPPIYSSLAMRELVASKLKGTGLEIGAGSNPFPVPLACRVIYGDRLGVNQLHDEQYPGEHDEIIPPDLETDLETFEGVDDSSLDFIVASHVIEHTRNPLGAILKANQKLKPGGQLILVVPDKERTFDRARATTLLEHLVLDYHSPSINRDKEHYFDFYTKAFNMYTPADLLEETIEKNSAIAYSIHFHTWTYESFGEMISYLNEHVAKWSRIWSHPTLPNIELDNEFYFVLTK